MNYLLFQFFRRFTAKPVDTDSPGTWVFSGGVSYWKDMHMTFSKKNPVAPVK